MGIPFHRSFIQFYLALGKNVLHVITGLQFKLLFFAEYATPHLLLYGLQINQAAICLVHNETGYLSSKQHQKARQFSSISCFLFSASTGLWDYKIFQDQTSVSVKNAD